MTFNSSDGHVTGEANLQGVSGIGLISGYRYDLQQQQTDWSRFTADGSSAGHFEFTEHLTRQREDPAPLPTGDDFYAKIPFHVVFDAAGTPHGAPGHVQRRLPLTWAAALRPSRAFPRRAARPFPPAFPAARETTKAPLFARLSEYRHGDSNGGAHGSTEPSLR